MTESSQDIRYSASVPGAWKYGITDCPVRIYRSALGESPEVVARGRAKLRRFGEPFEVQVAGYLLLNDWDKLGNGGAGEWVCTARPSTAAAD